MRTKLFAICLLFSSIILSGWFFNNDIPDGLFGFELGEVYEFPPEKNLKKYADILPVKEVTGYEIPLRDITRPIIYFKPLKDNKNFSFKTYKSKIGSTYGKLSSFRVKFIALVPRNVNSMEDLEKKGLFKQKVYSIQWNEYVAKKDVVSAKYWAYDMCNVFKSKLELEPDVTAFTEHNEYICEFESGGKYLEIRYFGREKMITLGYKIEIIENELKKINDFINKLRANEILE